MPKPKQTTGSSAKTCGRKEVKETQVKTSDARKKMAEFFRKRGIGKADFREGRNG